MKLFSILGNSKGFGALENLFSASGIAVMLTVASPQVDAIKMTVHETLTQANLRTVSTALEMYHMANNQYPGDFNNLTLDNPSYLNEKWESQDGKQVDEPHAGYVFEYYKKHGQFAVIANPVEKGKTGNKSFCIDATGSVFESETGFYKSCSNKIVK